MASQISDSEREALAQAIGINPKLDILGLKLSFKHEDMDIYKADNYSGHRVTNEGTKRMLRDFCDKTPLEQQRPLLKKALEDAGLVRLAELHLTDSTSQAASSSSGQAAVSETGRVTGQQPATQSRPSVSNTINASGSSSVSGNIMIGQQTNVHNSTPSAPVVHQHFTTNVKQAAAPAHAVARPIIIRPPVAVPMGQKRSANTSQNPPAKRQKVTQSGPSTSKGVTAKQKKAPNPKKKTQKKKAPQTAKAKNPSTSQNPPAKRQKVTQSGPSTSKGVTAKQKKAPNPQKKTQKKKAPQTAKAKNPKAPKASKKPAQKKNGPQSKKTQKKTTAKRQNPKSHKKAKMSKAKTAGKGRSKKK
ncbi:translation initiation factor IF-2-like isoform X1 [Lytechinus variegatus]|uniref:translation initiation factor IF-2-like isoform X1 n=1 Tax=Lytechinus variegatus TaxID=7654 RepID=UPI001BB13C17|nr:translation initiation factor IF-2-like isoform X1 [Lytechinus variegatus]